MNWLLCTSLMFITGSLIALQGVVNGSLGRQLGFPLHAALISFGVGFLSLTMITLFFGRGLPLAQLSNIPPVNFVGGLLGVIYVTSVIFIVPQIGIANTVIASLLGQVMLSIVLDHYGTLGLEKSSIDVFKLLGVVFIALGLLLVNFKRIF